MLDFVNAEMDPLRKDMGPEIRYSPEDRQASVKT